MPETGLAKQEIFTRLKKFKQKDTDWKKGKTFSLVFYPGEEVSEILKEAYTLFFYENGLNPSIFRSLKRMESEVISMTAELLHAPETAVGNMTSGGTESIICAVKAAKKWSKTNKKTVSPNLVLPQTAHPAFYKAADYLDIEIRLAKCIGEDLMPDMAHFESLIDNNTIMILGSAPAYPHGLIDPLQAINDLAEKHQVWMHVDACVGGYILPFLEQLEEPIPKFDFRLPAVNSMSLDIHKYGYGAKGSSAVVYRNSELRKNQYYVYTEWPAGLYASPSVTGTRPGGAIAAAWAIMHYLGKSGYRELAKKTLSTAQKIQKAINQHEGVHVIGNPKSPVFSFAGSKTVDIYRLGDELSELGWNLDRQLLPPSLHLTVSNGNVAYVNDFISDLNIALTQLSKKSFTNTTDKWKQKAAALSAKFLPDPVLRKIINTSIQQVPNQTDNSGKTAPLYGLMGELSGTGTLEDMVLNLLDAMNKPGKESFEDIEE